jgi:hypothetical protein
MAKSSSKSKSRGKGAGSRIRKNRGDTEPRSHGMPRGVPDRKISETLLDFASPLLELVGDDASAEQVHELLMIAVTVWNAMVMEEWGHGQHFLDQVRAQLKDPRVGPLGALVEVLIERRRERFAHDLRAIGHFEVRPDPVDRFRIYAEARLADSLMRAH